jgi:hypothetical protein
MALHIYGDESGQVGGKHFLIGLLFVASTKNTEYERQLQKLKLEHKFTHRELHYSELNRFKSDFAKVVVDWYFGATEAVFKCTVVPGGIFDLQRFRGNTKFISAEEMSYNVIYKNAINFHSTDAEKAEPKVLIVDRKDKARPDEFQRFLMKSIPNVVDMQEAPSENHNLLQVVDLLAGCVNGDLNSVQKFDKRTVIDHIKTRLGITHFRERNAYTKEKFRVNFWKPPAQKQSSPTSA